MYNYLFLIYFCCNYLYWNVQLPWYAYLSHIGIFSYTVPNIVAYWTPSPAIIFHRNLSYCHTVISNGLYGSSVLEYSLLSIELLTNCKRDFSWAFSSFLVFASAFDFVSSSLFSMLHCALLKLLLLRTTVLRNELMYQ